MRIIRWFALPVVFVLFGCSVARQIEEAKAFAKCEFSLESVQNAHLADVNIQGVRSIKDLSLKKAARLTEALDDKTLPLTFDLILHAKNPNPKPAAMNKLEWILFIDENQMVSGALEEKIAIPDSGENSFPLHIAIDLKKSSSGSSRESLLKLAFNVAGEGNQPSHIMVKAKPWIDVAGFNIEYPGYIEIKHDVKAGDGKKMREKALDKK